jgi:hypothetical protein
LSKNRATGGWGWDSRNGRNSRDSGELTGLLTALFGLLVSGIVRAIGIGLGGGGLLTWELWQAWDWLLARELGRVVGIGLGNGGATGTRKVVDGILVTTGQLEEGSTWYDWSYDGGAGRHLGEGGLGEGGLDDVGGVTDNDVLDIKVDSLLEGDLDGDGGGNKAGSGGQELGGWGGDARGGQKGQDHERIHDC